MKLMERAPLLKPHRTIGTVSMKILGHRVKQSRGSSPELNHPSHPLDTAPKGAETHPGDGRLSVGNASLPLNYIYHAWHPYLAYVAVLAEVNSR